jgi:hypothetical protein
MPKDNKKFTITTWSSFLLERLIVAQLVKKFPGTYCLGGSFVWPYAHVQNKAVPPKK